MKTYGLFDLYEINSKLITTISAPCIQVAIDNATSEIEHTEAELDYWVDVENDTAQNGRFIIEGIRDDERGGS